MVDDPARQLFEKGTVWVDEDRLLVLHRLVAALTEARGVIEITSCYSLEEEQKQVINREFWGKEKLGPRE